MRPAPSGLPGVVVSSLQKFDARPAESIEGICFGASCCAVYEVQSSPVSADPTYPSCRIPNDERVIRHVLDDDATRTDERPTPNGAAGNDSTVGPKRCATQNPRWLEVASPHLGSRIAYVREHAAWAEKYLVFEGDSVVNADVVLNPAGVADNDVARNEYILPEHAIGAQGSPVHDVTKMPDFGSCTNAHR